MISLNSANCDWSHKYINYDKLTDTQIKILGLPFLGDLYEHYFVKEDAELYPDPKDIRILAIGDPQINGNWPITPYIKRLDNYANDYYIGHIYNMMKPRLNPTHVAVMGDMFSSQWIGDSEFYNRTGRFMNRLFPRPINQTFAELDFIAKHEDADWESHFGWFNKQLHEGKFARDDLYGYENVRDWSSANLTTEPLFINITGNHDIGYGDTTYQHMCRWRILFGKDNYWIEYDNDTDHPWRIVVLNSLALDGPLLQPEFQEYEWQFVDALANKSYNGTTILMTHIPMYKREGLCSDGPYVDYFNKTNCPPGANCRLGLLKSENHLQYETSQRVLNAAFKNSSGIIMTGHDHVGCVNYYNYDSETNIWEASKDITSPKHIRELTVRSIMGEFDGNTGIVTGHFNYTAHNWDFDYTTCPFTIQHVWWGAKVSLALAILLQTLTLFF
ncbi:hypothetical protein FOA43_001157 [Brettanomyces nanus]|uniref:Calcineurin-like phosphoesterase domain-containing protein n=1 Tax=Eeniella nana TaxID=13502 RepID=A0A875S159_EENNA|nr:uncharacterized protein FOA43_001157 [Brettanomyces nanus]QPG73842.1 hypothetical protein FOA43_001157 [Brettanomyces nanus]